MKKTVKYLSDTKVAVTVTLDPSELKDAELAALVTLGREIKVPGFRKGKVPASVVAKHVDQNTLAQHTLESALSKAVADAFLSEKLQALDRPEVEVKKFIPGSELEFVAESEVVPRITLGDYKKLTAKPESVKITAAEVEDVIGRIKKGYAEKKTVNRAAKLGDEVTIDFEGKKDGVAFPGGKADGHQLLLGSGQFIPGFEDGIVGKKAGETFDLELTFPEEYHAADLKGQKVTFTTTLHEVKEVIEPELTDELAKKAGPFATVNDLKDDITRELTNQKEAEAREKFKDALVTELVEKSTVPVPEILLNDQVRSIERDMVQNLMYQGLSLEDYLAEKKFKDKDTWIEKEAKPAARKRVQAGLVLAELSKVEKIEATSEELLARMNQLGQQYPNEEVRKQLKTPEAQRDIANRILTEKTVDMLVDLYTKKK